MRIAGKPGSIVYSILRKARTDCCYICIMNSIPEALDKRPVLTKSISSGIAGLLGDLTTQTVEWGFGDAPVPWSTPHVS